MEREKDPLRELAALQDKNDRNASQIAADAAQAAENSTLELEQKVAIARRAAQNARSFARAAYDAKTAGKDDLARDYARRAIQESKTAADAAALIL